MSIVRKNRIAVAGIIGLLVGTISAQTFFAGSWTALVFWGIAGLLVGAICADTGESRLSGLVFGFVLTLAFLLVGFKGAQSELTRFLVLSLALSLVGAICGLVLAAIGYFSRARLSHSDI